MSIITLTTDFGTQDEYVGVMKGVILSINSSTTIVDICHGISPQNVIQAAYMLKGSFEYFPKGTVHIAVVDPGVGTERAIVAIKMPGHIFLAPDNGLLTLLLDTGQVDTAVRVEDSRLFLKHVSRTFHGRDIFAPVGAHIAGGLDIQDIGASLDPASLIQLPLKCSYTARAGKIPGELTGKIISIDRFGNLITNIDLKSIEMLCKTGPKNKLLIKIRDFTISGLSATYKSVAALCPISIIGSRGYLEIAVNCGSACQYFNAETGEPVRVFSV